MPTKPKILKKTLLAETRLFCIEAVDLLFSNGEQRQFERLLRNQSVGAVMIIPMIDKETVLLIREYSVGVERYELGLPKGKIDAGEEILATANRELKEEIGYGAKKLHHLTSLSIAPAYLEHMIEVIVAEDLYVEKLVGDEPEELEVIPWKLDNIEGLIATGECTEARSIAALYMAKDYFS
jgi:ADP-ribose diphosphatase